MLYVGLSIIAGIGLLILIVWMLHKNQQKENAETVDRTLPLPPLELRETHQGDFSDPEEILGLNKSTDASTTTKSQASIDASEPTADITPPPSPANDQWLELSKAQQAEGDFAQALSTCSKALPQLGAFKQCLLILRAQIRTLKKAQQADDAALALLYQHGAMASFFHHKGPGQKPLSPSACKKIDYSKFAHLRTPYQELGYEHLSLLTKTDIKWLTQAWGEPNAHTPIRELHAEQWQTLHSTPIKP